MPDFKIRPGKRHDAADLAILDNLAGHSIPVMFWQDQTATNRLEDAFAVGRDRLADDDGFYNWKKARIAEDETQILGMHISYVMPEPDEESENIKQSKSAFKPVFELYDEAVGHWFIDALAVYPSAQGRGIGKSLFENSLSKGTEQGLKIMSLIVEDTNENAYALYRSYGFEIISQRDFVPFEGAREINEWLLLSRELS